MRPPVPPFAADATAQKVRAAEDAVEPARSGNGRAGLHGGQPLAEPRRVPRKAARRLSRFLRRKWAKEQDYRLIKELWAFTGDRIAVRFAYEWHDAQGQWFRSYGNENWRFDAEAHALFSDVWRFEAPAFRRVQTPACDRALAPLGLRLGHSASPPEETDSGLTIAAAIEATFVTEECLKLRRRHCAAVAAPSTKMYHCEQRRCTN